MQEIEFDNEIYEFPDEATEDQILEFFQPESEKHKLEPGIYQDEENALFRIDEHGNINPIT